LRRQQVQKTITMLHPAQHICLLLGLLRPAAAAFVPMLHSPYAGIHLGTCMHDQTVSIAKTISSSSSRTNSSSSSGRNVRSSTDSMQDVHASLAMQGSGQASAALQAKLPTYLKDAEAFVSEGLEAADEPQPRQQTLGELLLGLPPPQPTQSHLSDAGLVLDHEPVPAAAAAAVAAMAAAAAAGQQPADTPQDQQQQQQQQEQQQGQDGEGAAEQQQDPEAVAAMLQESLLQANAANRAEIEAMLIRCASWHGMYGMCLMGSFCRQEEPRRGKRH
jgi:hypothetical protein